jgi:2-succinyl-6-hydroxy-2,4-cyclohexadiene-1-carboxylate synthase
VIRHSKLADERRECGPCEVWCLHGAVGSAGDWRAFASLLAKRGIGSRAVDLWRFLDCAAMPLTAFGAALNAEAGGEVTRGGARILLGYSMGGRLALHALLSEPHPWSAAVIVSAHPGLEDPGEREARRASDAAWAAAALTGNWSDFLASWNAQPVLGGTAVRDDRADRQLAQRRREIARSYVDWSLGAQQPLWDKLPGIRIPVLWIAGENDARYLDLARRATSLLPMARLAVAPAAGHRAPWEADAWMADEIAGFLRNGAA